jgi:hypothetical protein
VYRQFERTEICFCAVCGTECEPKHTDPLCKGKSNSTNLRVNVLDKSMHVMQRNSERLNVRFLQIFQFIVLFSLHCVYFNQRCSFGVKWE